VKPDQLAFDEFEIATVLAELGQHTSVLAELVGQVLPFVEKQRPRERPRYRTERR
jgi:hypothetical protein